MSLKEKLLVVALGASLLTTTGIKAMPGVNSLKFKNPPPTLASEEDKKEMVDVLFKFYEERNGYQILISTAVKKLPEGRMLTIKDVPVPEGYEVDELRFVSGHIVNKDMVFEIFITPMADKDGLSEEVKESFKKLKGIDNVVVEEELGEADLTETPIEPEAPEVPDIPAEPEKPAEPETPETPEVPVKPDIPVEPEVPEIPEIPVGPEVPVEPELPETPENPEVPVEPTNPGEVEEPEKPGEAEEDGETEEPMDPVDDEKEDPEEIEVPEEPVVPEIPDTPVEPEVPEVPEIPVEPELPTEPEITDEDVEKMDRYKKFNKGISYDVEKLNLAFLKLVNEERASKGLVPLEYGKHLQKGTDIRSEELVEYGNTRIDGVPHVRVNGDEFHTAFEYLPDAEKHVGENLVIGGVGTNYDDYKDGSVSILDQREFLTDENFIAEKLFNAWKNSPGHYANMMGEDYRSTALSVKLKDKNPGEGGEDSFDSNYYDVFVGVQILDLYKESDYELYFGRPAEIEEPVDPVKEDSPLEREIVNPEEDIVNPEEDIEVEEVVEAEEISEVEEVAKTEEISNEEEIQDAETVEAEEVIESEEESMDNLDFGDLEEFVEEDAENIED